MLAENVAGCAAGAQATPACNHPGAWERDCLARAMHAHAASSAG